MDSRRSGVGKNHDANGRRDEGNGGKAYKKPPNNSILGD
jgi:hypothetical protein